MNKLVIRVMEGDRLSPDHGRMLGWQETLCYARGDGQLWAGQTVHVPIEHTGTASYVSVHWADVNVDVRLPINESVSAKVGDILTVLTVDTPIFRVGPQSGGLPPTVTRAPVSVNVRLGDLGAAGR